MLANVFPYFPNGLKFCKTHSNQELQLIMDDHGLLWQASSTRQNLEEDRVDFDSMPGDALKLAATLAAVCQVGVEPDDVIDQLKKWWADVGKNLLLLSALDNPHPEDGFKLIKIDQSL